MVHDRRLSPALWRNVLWLISGNGLRLILSGTYFVLLTRLLGPEGFGLFSGILACTNLMAPFAYMGQFQLLSQQLSRWPERTSRMWGHAGIMTLVLGSVLSGILWLPLWGWLPGASFLAVGILLFSELVIAGIQYVHKGVLIGHERISGVSVIDTGMALARLLTVIGAGVWGVGTLEHWSVLYGGMMLLIGWITYGGMVKGMGSPDLRWELRGEAGGERLAQGMAGWEFAVGGVAMLAFMDLDKLLLPRLSSAVAAGEYSAAYRLVTFAQIPIMALMTSSLAEVCRQGRLGLRQGVRYGSRLAPWTLGYGILAALAMAWGAGIVPRVLGSGYGETAVILTWLSPLIFLEGIHLLLGTILAGADRLTWRSRIQLLALVANGLLNGLWIPSWGWRGAAAATVVAEVGLILGLMIYLGWSLRREPPLPVV